MRLLPWRRETRASNANYSSVVQDAILALAEGKAAASPVTTAAVEACASLWARAFAQATVSPSGLVSASMLYDLGRDLALSGEYVALLEVGPHGPVFVRPASHSVRGGHREGSWTYDMWLGGPTASTRVQVPRDRVIHVRINSDSATPWAGRSPIAAARSTGRLLAELEGALADEGTVPVGRVVSSPEGPNKTGVLQKSLNALRGKLVLAETVAGGYGDKGAAPMTDWKPQRLGPDYTAAEISLRDTVERSVCAAYGIHPSLLGAASDGTAMRESWRRAQRATFEPCARLAEEQLARVFETEVSLDFSRLRAGDTAGQSRAFRALAGREATIDQERALVLSGVVDGVAGVKKEPGPR